MSEDGEAAPHAQRVRVSGAYHNDGMPGPGDMEAAKAAILVHVQCITAV